MPKTRVKGERTTNIVYDEARPDAYFLIACAGYAAYRNAMVGNPAPRVADYLARVDNPQPGDLVLEVTTIHRVPWKHAGLGWLLRIAREPVWTPETWAEEEGDRPYSECPTQKVWYIDPLDPNVKETPYRWEDAEFVTIPNERVPGWME